MERQENTFDRIMGAIPGVSTLYGLGKAIFGGDSNKKQMEMQKELMSEQERSAMRLAEKNKQLAKNMWDETNVGAQIDHLKKNNMSVSMMYKGGGAGGQTMGMGMGMPSTSGAPDPNASKAIDLNTAQTAANIELTKAQTDNLKADTVKKAGADTELVKAEAAFKEILTKYQTESLEDQLSIIANEKFMRIDEAGIKQNERQVSDETTRGEIKRINQLATNTALEAIAINQRINLDKAKIQEISNGIQQKWRELNINETKSRWEHEDRLTQIKEYTTNALKVAGIHAAGNLVGDVVNIATRQAPKGKPSHRVNEYPDGGTSTTYFR